ncbi:Uncharacterized protein FWK35_00037959, partial [Aphis craccivora]
MSNIVKLSSSIENQQDFHERRVIEADNSCALIVKTPNTFNAVVNTEVEVTKVESKWTKAKYQRCEREKRRRERTLLHDKLPQPLITNFFPLLDKVSKLIGENTNLRNLFIESIEDNKTLTLDKKLLDSNTLLKCLYECASKNQLNTKNNNRFDEQLKKFSVYLFIVGGRLLYETLHKNMNDALPSISTLFRFLDNTQNNVTEGCFRFEELRVFLIKRNLPPKIWISEDATSITGKIEYDAKSNKVIGFVLPLENGCPLYDSFPATSAKRITEYFHTGIRANYAYVIMAQSLDDKAPPFCVAIYGTDNRFTNEDVMSRWNFMKLAAASQGIEIIGFSSDGDTRLLKTMQLQSLSMYARESNLNVDVLNDTIETAETANDWSWFSIGHPPIVFKDETNREIYIQDTVHIGTKLRTRFLKPNIVLPMGTYFASVDHLIELTRNYTKDKHLLTMTDLKPEDKMNFQSAQKMCSTKVLEILSQLPDTN